MNEEFLELKALQYLITLICCIWIAFKVRQLIDIDNKMNKETKDESCK